MWLGLCLHDQLWGHIPIMAHSWPMAYQGCVASISQMADHNAKCKGNLFGGWRGGTKVSKVTAPWPSLRAMGATRRATGL